MPWVLEALNLGRERVLANWQCYLGSDWLYSLLWERKYRSWNDNKDSLRWSGKLLGNMWHLNFIFSDISGWPKSSFGLFCKKLPKSWANILANPIISWGHLLRLGKVSLSLQAWGIRKGWCLPDERNESSLTGKQQIDESSEIPWFLGSPKFDMAVIHRMLSVCWKSRGFGYYKTKFQAQQSKECPGSPYPWALCCSFIWHNPLNPFSLLTVLPNLMHASFLRPC